ncbi:MAG: hypothetical protein ABFC31_12345 [Clostridiaceae bacterium]
MRQCENCEAFLDPEERCDCEQDKVPDKEIVRVLQEEFSGYDQPLHSKVKNPGKYGIMRIPRAERILRRAFPRESMKRREKENRKRMNKHTFRLDDAEEGCLQTAMEQYGIEHLQDFVLMAFHWFFENCGMLQIPIEKETAGSR